MMKKYLIVALGLMGSACATTYQPSYYYNEILVVNNSKELVQDVTISATNNGRVFSCGNIAPFGICSNRIGKRRYEQNPIQVSWTFGGSSNQTEAFVIKVPATFYTAFPLRGVVAIEPDGSISTYFEQDTPSI